MPDNHDIKLTIGSTTKRLYLSRTDTGKMWGVSELYNQDIGTDKLFEQTDWSGGFGQGDFLDANRYEDGFNIDTTKEGYFMLGPAVNAVNDVRALVEGAVAQDGAVYTVETDEAQDNSANDMTLLPAAPAVDDAYYFGFYFTFDTLYLNIGTNGSGTWTITWEYYNGSWTSLSGVTDNTSGFTAGTGVKSVTFTEPGDWTTVNPGGAGAGYYIRARVSAYTSIATQPLGTQAWVEGSIRGTLTKMVYFNSTIYAAALNGLFEWDNTNEFWLQTAYFGATITDLCVFNSKLYIALGSTTAYQYTSDGVSFTATDLTDDDFTYFMAAPAEDGLSTVLWGADSNYLKSTTDPDAGGTEWSSARYIGDDTRSITGIMQHAYMILAGKPDGLYHLDTDGKVYPVLTELALAQSTNNFKWHVNYKGALYFSLDTRIGRLNSNLIYELVDPYQNVEELTDIAYCSALTCDRDYIYAAMNTGSNINIFKGYEKDGAMSWSPIYRQTASSIDYMAAIQLGTDNPRLWLNYSTNSIYYFILSDNPLGDSDYQFTQATAQLVTGWFDLGNRDWTKILESIDCECRASSGDLSSTIKVTVYYYTDEGSAGQIDTAYTDNNSGGTRKYLNASTLDNGKKIRFAIRLNTDDSDITPVIKYFAAYGRLKPNYIKIFNFGIDIDPDFGSMSDTKTLKDFIYGGRTSTGLITLTDPHLTDHYVTIPPGGIEEVMVMDEDGKQYKMVLKIRAIESDWS